MIMSLKFPGILLLLNEGIFRNAPMKNPLQILHLTICGKGSLGISA